MFSFTKSDFQRFAVSSVGAVALSAASLFAAAGPVKAATTPMTTAAWSDEVAGRIAAVREHGNVAVPEKLTRAQVAVRFTADGDYAGVGLAQSSGDRRIDARALKVAARVAYPALPDTMLGQPQTVRLNVYFGGIDHVADYAAVQARAARVQLAAKKNGKIEVAAR